MSNSVANAFIGLRVIRNYVLIEKDTIGIVRAIKYWDNTINACNPLILLRLVKIKKAPLSETPSIYQNKRIILLFLWFPAVHHLFALPAAISASAEQGLPGRRVLLFLLYSGWSSLSSW